MREMSLFSWLLDWVFRLGVHIWVAVFFETFLPQPLAKKYSLLQYVQCSLLPCINVLCVPEMFTRTTHFYYDGLWFFSALLRYSLKIVLFKLCNVMIWHMNTLWKDSHHRGNTSITSNIYLLCIWELIMFRFLFH